MTSVSKLSTLNPAASLADDEQRLQREAAAGQRCVVRLRRRRHVLRASTASERGDEEWQRSTASERLSPTTTASCGGVPERDYCVGYAADVGNEVIMGLGITVRNVNVFGC
ncbi:hypothetical protein HN51_054076 [Arachis hypogaea]